MLGSQRVSPFPPAAAPTPPPPVHRGAWPAGSSRSALAPATAAALVLVVLGSAGCSDDEITVVVCGDLAVPDDLDAVRVELLDAELGRIRDGVFRLVPDEIDEGMDAPQAESLPVAPSLTRPTGRGWVRVVPLLDGVAVGQFDREILSFDGVASVDAVLDSRCRRSFCPAGQTCIEGNCQVAPLASDPPGCAP
ncbi:MAG TPA: hypothetical protein RMF84_04785 [Polyangiaceae bacterium LLY-WYZ-14_1]|jgi:hypothetical protein|nr:hypothetical protein [Polyangiaceae bacterium LLY-WYZ-14_1]